MFRAIKDILTEGRREGTGTGMYEGKYYETSTGRGAPVTPGGGFTPAETTEFTKEGIPVILERREAGAIVKEIIHPTEKIEIQPVVRREREQVEVRELNQPILEKASLPTKIREEILPEERKVMGPLSAEAIEEPLRRAKEGLAPSRIREVAVRTVEEKPPIVEESIRKKVYEEIVPIVERHVTEHQIIKEKKPIYEKVVEGPFFVVRELPRIEREVPIQFTGEQMRYGGAAEQQTGAGYGAGRYAEEPLPAQQYKYEGTRGKGLVDVPIRSGMSYSRTTELQPEQVRHAY